MAINCGSLLKFGLLWQRVSSVSKVSFISYSPISYFGHACPKLSFVLVSRLGPTGRYTEFKKTSGNIGRVDILWT